MARPNFKSQLNILIGRNLSIHLSSSSTLVLLLVQPPLIGYFIGRGWRAQEPNARTFFVMAVASIWMGCMNACCEIVKERAVFDRERMFNLNILSYLISKVVVLTVIAGVQSILLLVVIGRMVHLQQRLDYHLLYFLVLTFTAVSASGLGLASSTFARTSYAAAITVPILIIPQIIFSEVLLQENIDKNIPSKIEKCTITKWSYQALKNVEPDGGGPSLGGFKLQEDEPRWATFVSSFFMLSLACMVFLVIAYFKLSWDT